MKSFELIKTGETLHAPIDESSVSTHVEREDKRLISCEVKNGEMLRLKVIEGNFSLFEKFSFWVYSEEADGETFEVRLYNPIGAHTLPDKPRYSGMKVKRDFTGIKLFEFETKNMSGPVPYPSHCNYVNLTLHYIGEGEGRAKNFEIGGFSALEEHFALSGEAKEDFGLIKKKTKKSLVGDGSAALLSNPRFIERLKKINTACREAWDGFKATFTGKKDTLYGYKIIIEPLEGERSIAAIYGKLADMAKGYAARGGEFYKRSELFSDIVRGLDFMYDNYYGKCVDTEGIWGNWWTWQIGIPGELLNILILLEEDLTKEQIEKYLYPVDYYLPYPTMTACNRMWRGHRCILAAALHGDGVRIVRARKMLLGIFEYVTAGDGFYEDGSFVQHGTFSYTGGYGLGLLSTAVRLCYLLADTPFAFNEEVTSNQYRWALETFIPSMYKGRLFASMRGREVSRATSEGSAARSALSSFTVMSTYAPESVNNYLLPVIKEVANSPEGDGLFGSVSAELVLYLEDIAKNENIPAPKIDSRVKSFARVDRVARSSEKYGACVALSSKRTLKYESINRENKTGWYLSDGMLYLYDGKYDHDKDFYYYVNPYRLPGVTATSAPRAAECFQYSIQNGNNFAGGIEGEFGLAAQDLEYTPGGRFFECDLKAKKTYFFFDKEIVALGTGITDTSGEGVYTTHVNRKWQEGERVYLNGEKIALCDTGKAVKAEYVYFDGFGGYVFPRGAELEIAKKSENYDFCPLGRAAEEREDKISGIAFFEALEHHGKKPKGASYACIYLPKATKEETEEYYRAPEAEIVEATESVHAVKKGGGFCICFFEAASSHGISSSASVLVTISLKKDGVTLAVCDPTQEKESLTLVIDCEKMGEQIGGEIIFKETDNDRFSVKKQDNVYEIMVNLKDNLGRTYTLN